MFPESSRTSEAEPRSILEAPSPGVFYPRRKFSDLRNCVRALNLKMPIVVDIEADTQIIDSKTGKIYWFNQDCKLKFEIIPGVKSVKYHYDDKGRLCGKDSRNVTQVGPLRERYVYDSDESVMFTKTAFDFNDAIVY